MSIRRLGVLIPDAGVAQQITSVSAQHFASAIITNLNTIKESQITIYVKPVGATLPSEYIYILYNFPLSIENSMETNRFALNAEDEIWVKSDVPDVSFLLEGIPQTDLGLRYSVGPTAQLPLNPSIGDQFYDTILNTLNVYKSTGWKVITTSV